jgi:hypothetical protein
MKPIAAISLHLIPVGMLALALGELPLDVYMLIHVVVFGASLLIAALVYNQDRNFNIWIGLFLLAAIIFNPIVPLHLTRRIWAILDIAAAVLFAGHYLNIRKSSEEKAGWENRTMIVMRRIASDRNHQKMRARLLHFARRSARVGCMT